MYLYKFKARVHVDGHYTVEDPHCPSEWRGSGVYDREIATWIDTDVELWAKSYGEAEKLILGYDFADGTVIDIEDVFIKKIEYLCCAKETEADDDIVLSDPDWKEEPRYEGPDPDDYYDRKREEKYE